METYHDFERDGKRFRFVHDTDHQTIGSYHYETEELTRAAEQEELARLADGTWVVLGALVYERCPRETHCSECSGWVETDSLWGIVIENAPGAVEAFAREVF